MFSSARRLLRLRSLLLLLTLGIGLVAPVHGLRAQSSPDVVISQVYSGAGSGGAVLNADYVELFNRGTEPVSLDGWSLQYASAKGTTWTAVPLSGELPPGGFYLVSGQANDQGAPLPTPDVAGLPPLAKESGRLALVSNSTPLTCGADPVCASAAGVVDFLGYGTEDARWQGLAPAARPGVERALIREGSGCLDSDDNAADFRLRPPTPHNSDSAEQPCDPQTGLPIGGLATVSSPSIRDIQGSGHVSPLLGQEVVAVPGVVTAVGGTGFWMQDPLPDDDLGTSEGILVHLGRRPLVRPGNAVLVSGVIDEFRPGFDPGNLSTTEIIASSVQVAAPNHRALISPTLVGPDGRVLPTENIDDDVVGFVETSGSVDPTSDAIDLWESLEGMLVQIEDAVATGPRYAVSAESYRLPVLPGNGVGAGERTLRDGIIIRPLGDEIDANPERIILNLSLLPPDAQLLPNQRLGSVSTSDQITTPISGVVDYSFGNYETLPLSPLTVAAANLQPEVADPAGANELAVATFNVENLDPNDPVGKFTQLAEIIVDKLQSPDLLMLEEVQDNSGIATDDGVVDADETIEMLKAAITAAGGPTNADGSSTYQYVDIDPAANKDGGEPGGNIRVGFLYRADRGLSFTGVAGGTATNEVAVVTPGPHLSFNPGRIQADSDDPDPDLAKAFDGTRKPLVGEFTYNGHPIFVIGNHWTSKGADEALYGREQPPERLSEPKRDDQATLVRRFVDSLFAADGDANVVVLGDLNDYWFSQPLQTIVDGGSAERDLLDLMTTLPANQRYGYVFEGNSQDLDHILMSPSLEAALVPESFDVVHVNAEFADQASDHDPQVVRFLLPPD